MTQLAGEGPVARPLAWIRPWTTKSAGAGAAPTAQNSTPMRRVGFGWALCSAVVALVGCSSSSPSSGVASPSAPGAAAGSGHGSQAASAACTALTKMDAAAALGRSVKEGVDNAGDESDPTQGDGCTYCALPTSDTGSIELILFAHADASAAAQFFDSFTSGVPSLQAVPGVGDNAYFLPAGAGGGQLLVLDGAEILQLILKVGSQPNALDSLRPLALQIVGRL